MIEVTVLTQQGCQTCESVIHILNNLEPEYNLRIREVLVTSQEGKNRSTRHNIGTIPAVIINNELISTGPITKDELKIKLEKLKNEKGLTPNPFL